MKPKTTRILYWTLTIIYVLAMVMDGVSGVMRVQEGKDVMIHLGYPEYAMTIFGIAKLLGAVALLQTRYITIKEWAFAGFIINYIGAFASRAFVGDEVSLLLMPVIMLVITFFYYYVWKRFEQLKTRESM